jgi:hypothetical protein
MKGLASLVKDFRIDGFSIDLERQRKFMELSIQGLSVLTSLQSIGLSNICLYAEIVDSLASLPSLQSLTLINCRTERHSVQDLSSLSPVNVSKTPVREPVESSFRELNKVTILRSDFALLKHRISPDIIREINYESFEDMSQRADANRSLLPYPAPALPQLRHLSVSISRGVDLGVFLHDLSCIHSLVKLVIRQVWLTDTYSPQNLPKTGNRAQPILSELRSLVCPVILLQYFVGCPIHTLDLTPACNASATHVIDTVDLPIPTFPSLHALVIPHPLLIKVVPLGERFPQLHDLDLQFKIHRNLLTTLTPLNECLTHLCNPSSLPHLETLIMRHLNDMYELDLVVQRDLLENPIKNAFPSLTKASFFETVDWYWSHEEKDWSPFIPLYQRQYVTQRESEWVDYKGYLESVIRPIIVRQKELPIVRVPVSFR